MYVFPPLLQSQPNLTHCYVRHTTARSIFSSILHQSASDSRGSPMEELHSYKASSQCHAQSPVTIHRSTVHKFIPKLSTSRKWWNRPQRQICRRTCSDSKRRYNQLWRWRHSHEPVVLVLPQPSWLGKVKTHIISRGWELHQSLRCLIGMVNCRSDHHALYLYSYTSIILRRLMMTSYSLILSEARHVIKRSWEGAFFSSRQYFQGALFTTVATLGIIQLCHLALG